MLRVQAVVLACQPKIQLIINMHSDTNSQGHVWSNVLRLETPQMPTMNLVGALNSRRAAIPAALCKSGCSVKTRQASLEKTIQRRYTAQVRQNLTIAGLDGTFPEEERFLDCEHAESMEMP